MDDKYNCDGCGSPSTMMTVEGLCEECSDLKYPAVKHVVYPTGLDVVKSQSDPDIEVCFPNEHSRIYNSYTLLSDDIVCGDIRKGYKARIVTELGEDSEISEADDQEDDVDEQESWSTVEEVVKSIPKLRSLYGPVEHYAYKGGFYGFVSLSVISAVLLATQIIMVNAEVGIVFVVATLTYVIGPRFPILYALAFFIAFKLGVKFSVFMMPLGMFFAAAVLGIPAGMFIGGLIGSFKSKKIRVAYDANRENRPFLRYVLIPLTVSIIFTSGYLLWFVPMVEQYLSTN